MHSLRPFLREHITKYAEKNIILLRQYFAKDAKLISNQEIIEAFVNGALEMCHWDNHLEKAARSTLVFEAILEDVDVKTDVFRKIAKQNPNVFILSNTSSIPISLLNEKGDLHNNIIGYHFYNPPPVQKLLEVIVYDKVNPALKEIALELAKRLHKIVVVSHDVAGFIGNGHFIREIVFAAQQVEALSKDHPLEESIYIVNRVTQDWLLRPMGIFQLLDYVGLDVCPKILEIMKKYLPDPSLDIGLIQPMLDHKIVGGQHTNGSQKQGFFFYGPHGIEGVYSVEQKRYVPLATAPWRADADKLLGKLPDGYYSWKALQKDREKNEHMKTYFHNLYSQDTFGAKLAQEFLENSKRIGDQLVKNNVAKSINDVDVVLMNGFYHLYGADTFAGVKELT